MGREREPDVTTEAVTVTREKARPTDFETFYRDARMPVYRGLALTLGDADLAADAVDEAMVRSYQQWRVVSGYENPQGWAYRVGLNWARSRLRKLRRERRHGQLPEHPIHDPEPADPALAHAIEMLPLPMRSVVVLRYLFDWSTDQVADALNLPPGTVKSRLSRALRKLNETLETP